VVLAALTVTDREYEEDLELRFTSVNLILILKVVGLTEIERGLNESV
jgi:hypothetical protein